MFNAFHIMLTVCAYVMDDVLPLPDDFMCVHDFIGFIVHMCLGVCLTLVQWFTSVCKIMYCIMYYCGLLSEI